MEKQQTQVTDQNRQDFYRALYPMSDSSADQLIDLSQFGDCDCVLIDCAGKTYREQFPTSKIHILETISKAKQFQFTSEHFDKLIDTRVDDSIVWPKLEVNNPVIIFDRSPLLKYITFEVWQQFIRSAVEKYCPSKIIINQNLMFIDDCRMQDRFYSLSTFRLANYVVEQFVYDTDNLRLNLKLKRVTSIE